MFALKIAIEPDVEPVSLDEVKSQLRITGTDENVFLTRLITAARKNIETIIGRSLVTQTWDLYLDQFPRSSSQAIEIQKPPLQSIEYIKYYDNADVEQTWDAGEYVVDTDSIKGLIYPGRNYSYPTTRAFPKAVNVRFVSGYGDESAVPEDIKQAILLMVGHLERNREGTTGFKVESIPMGVSALIAPYKMFSM